MNYYEDSIEFKSLYKAMKVCCRNLRWKDSVVGYEANGLKNTYRLRQDLLNDTYKISKYQHFTIHEPKERDITATRIRDRQFQMAMCKGGLYDDFTKHYITDNPACQTAKGTDYALNRLTKHMSAYYRKYGNEGYVLKCDIRHFFPETNHEVAKRMVRKYVEDESACQRVCEIIDSFGEEKGMGLGSQISQLVELCVLTDLDHFIKERLHVKYYIRYMDDMILMHHDKEYLQKCRDEIAQYLANLQFELHPHKTQIYKLSQGVKFMNWRFVLTKTGRVLRLMPKSKLGRQRRRLVRLWEKEKKGEVEAGTTVISLYCWLANAKRGDTFYQRKRMIEFYEELTNEKYNIAKRAALVTR